MTESAETTSSSNVFWGGSAARGGSGAARSARSSGRGATTGSLGVGGGVAGGCDAAPLGQELVSVGVGSWRVEVAVEARVGGSMCLAAAVFGASGATAAADEDAFAALATAAVPITASVSCTGRTGRSEVAAAGEGAATEAGTA